MNCPTCGAPNVILHKDIWECGWCGDSGPIPRYILEQREAACERQEAWWQSSAATTRNAALTFVEAVTRLLPTYPESKSFAWRVVLCQVSAGLIESGLWNKTWNDEVDDSVIGRIFYPYRTLANDLADFSDISNRRVLERSVRSRKPLFQAEGQLTDKVCGKFWEMMIEQLPPYDKEEPSMQDGHLYMGRAFGGKNLAESTIEDALCSILPLAAFFAGCIGENADTRNNRFLGYFTKHWKRLRGEKVDPMDYADSAVARIVAQFPELKSEYARADLFNMFGEDLLEGIYNTDPQRAIAMWRSLPQKQAPLQDDGLSEDFFCLIDFFWKSEECDEDALTPLLDAVQRDETLAEMVFRSHYVCTLHLYLIQTAIEQGKTALAEHLYAMLQLNPLPREKWREEPDAFTALMKDLYNTAGHVPTYRYCSVQVGNNRPHAYLTAGLPVKRGDRVRVPYGKRNEPKEGVVRSVGDYTHDTAPWPPEKTKRVLEILPKPQVSVKKESTVPKPQQEHTKPEEPAHSAAPAPAGAVQDATRPTRKYGRIAIIVICFVLVGWLIFLAAQDVPKAQPAAVAPAASRTDSSSIATTPTASYAQYSGKLPVEGMPMKALSYTSLGAPDKELKCKNFEKLEPNRKYINVYWYDDSGELIAAGMCAQWEGDSEFVLKSFSQYYPTQPYEGQTFHSGSATDIGSGSGQSLREDYGDPEDLYEDGDYDDLDEAWDEWEEGW